jgi:ACS family hexuronate transporter-like MFS transporter
MGIFNSGSSTGALLAPPLIVWITIQYGWRNAFLIAAVGGFAWLFLWLVLFRKPQEHPWMRSKEVEALASDPDQQVGAKARKIPWARLLRYREVRGIVVARFLADPIWWFYVFWIFDYLKHQRGLSLTTIGKVGWIPFLTADLGCLVGGGLSSYLMRRGWSTDKARKSVMVPSALLMSGAALIFHSKSVWEALALISLATFAHQSWSTNMLTLPADLFPSQAVASVSGLSGFGAALGGFLVQGLTGYLLDHFSYAPVFALAAMMHPLAAIGLLSVVRNIRQLEAG